MSKYTWVQPLNDKTGVQLVKAFEKILKTGRWPIQLQTVRGEFYNKTFQIFGKGIDSSYLHAWRCQSLGGGTFQPYIEDSHVSLFHLDNTLRYNDVLQALVRGYNASKHSGIRMAPKDLTFKNERMVWKRLYGQRMKPTKKKPKFRVGDRVRLNKKHHMFKKGYLPGWTEEVFTVHRVIKGPVNTYKICELDDTPLEGTFYKEDLQKVHVDDDGLFRVE